MGIFADLYEDFYRVCVSDQRKKGRNTSSTRRLIDWIQDATDAFSELLKRVRALAGDSRNSMLETLTSHVKWFFSENEVKCLRLSLSVAQESIRGFSNVTLIEMIDEEIQVIRAANAQGNQQAIQALEDHLGATLEERLGELEQKRSVLSIERGDVGS
jgi:gamma-glutamyl:cysteine ligase YbdK (ATP-grasp superfamily)